MFRKETEQLKIFQIMTFRMGLPIFSPPPHIIYPLSCLRQKLVGLTLEAAKCSPVGVCLL